MGSGIQRRAEHEVVSALLESKAIDFNAIGAAVAKFGPSAAVDVDGEDWFCLTMKRFIILYKIPDPRGGPVVLGQVAAVAGELQG